MTNKARLISLLGFAPPTDALEGTMIDNLIDGSATYEAEDSLKLKNAAVELITLILTTADTTNTEGFSVRYDRKAVEARLKALQIELGLIDEGPIITGKSIW
jgi:hypothetical protein